MLGEGGFFMEKKAAARLLARRMKWLMGILLMLALMRWPEDMLQGAQQAMRAWYYTVAPALFPFMAIMPLLTCRESVEAWEAVAGRLMERLFHLPGAAAPAMIIAMLAGSPAGASAATRIAHESGMNRGQLLRLGVSVCGLSPAFLAAGIGAAMLRSPGDGVMLAISQALAQIALLFLLRNTWKERNEPVCLPDEVRQDSPMHSAVLSVLTVCGYMALFSGIAHMLRHLLGNAAGDFLLCALDAPSGAAMVSALYIERKAKLVLLSALTGFGGGCVGAQNLAVFRENGMRPGVYFAFRGIISAFSAAFMALQMRLNWEIIIANLPETYVIALLCAVIIAIPAIFSLKKSIS